MLRARVSVIKWILWTRLIKGQGSRNFYNLIGLKTNQFFVITCLLHIYPDTPDLY